MGMTDDLAMSSRYIFEATDEKDLEAAMAVLRGGSEHI